MTRNGGEQRHPARRRPRYGSGTGTERITAFSDGVFAIAITLLVLDLKVPDIPHGMAAAELPSQLLAMQPKFLTYVLSFVVVGLYWINHHRLFSYIRHYDPGLLWLNILYLLCISFIPFPTAILSEYGDQPLATALYAGTMAATGFVGTLLWWYATRERRLVDEDLDPRLVTYAMLRGVSAATIFLLSIPLAFFGPSVAHYAWLLIPVALNLLSRTYSREEAEGSRRAPAEGE